MKTLNENTFLEISWPFSITSTVSWPFSLVVLIVLSRPFTYWVDCETERKLPPPIPPKLELLGKNQTTTEQENLLTS